MMANCSIDGCLGELALRGWCNMHYLRWRRHGDPLGGGPRHFDTPEEALMARTERQGDCLVWTGSKTPGGYGQLKVKGSLVPSHRFAYEMSRGPIPDGLVIDHICHNPPCVNPDHLHAVTVSQNAENRAGAQRNSGSGVRGVSWYERDKRWVAEVGHKGTRHKVGRFTSLEDANAAVIAKRLEIHTNNIRDRISK